MQAMINNPMAGSADVRVEINQGPQGFEPHIEILQTPQQPQPQPQSTAAATNATHTTSSSSSESTCKNLNRIPIQLFSRLISTRFLFLNWK